MINWRLVVGITLVSAFFIVAIFGPLFAPYEKDFVEPSGYYYNNPDDFGMYASPYPPSKAHIFGTDEWGYDILTLLLYGAKYTIFIGVITAVLRMIIGGFLGMITGLKKKKRRTDNVFGLLGSIPAFIIVYFTMTGIIVNSPLSTGTLIMIQTTVMVLVGIPGVYAAVYSKTTALKQHLYITASSALGAGSIRIAIKHLLPHLQGTFMVMLLKEIILVLSLMGQLGIFNIFIGGTILRLGGPPVYVSITRDWAGLIGQWRSFIFDYQWILFYPLLAFVLLIFAFYMLLRGIELNQKGAFHKYPHI